MSAATSAHDDAPAVGERGAVEVTSHAALMWLERVDPAEQYPRQTLRQAWRDSEPSDKRHTAREYDGLVLPYESHGDHSDRVPREEETMRTTPARRPSTDRSTPTPRRVPSRRVSRLQLTTLNHVQHFNVDDRQSAENTQSHDPSRVQRRPETGHLVDSVAPATHAGGHSHRRTTGAAPHCPKPVFLGRSCSGRLGAGSPVRDRVAPPLAARARRRRRCRAGHTPARCYRLPARDDRRVGHRYCGGSRRLSPGAYPGRVMVCHPLSRWLFYTRRCLGGQAKLRTKHQREGRRRDELACWPDWLASLTPSFSDERQKGFPVSRGFRLGRPFCSPRPGLRGESHEYTSMQDNSRRKSRERGNSRANTLRDRGEREESTPRHTESERYQTGYTGRTSAAAFRENRTITPPCDSGVEPTARRRPLGFIGLKQSDYFDTSYGRLPTMKAREHTDIGRLFRYKETGRSVSVFPTRPALTPGGEA